jgi:quercetin dioxygenase-like cupin family protein
MTFPAIISKEMYEVFDVFGPTVAFLIPPSKSNDVYCVMYGNIPPGVSVPLHSHPDEESFYILSGQVDVISNEEDGYIWKEMKKGDFVHVPANVKHAWRNSSDYAVEGLITTTATLGRFFMEIGRRVEPGKSLLPPTPEQLQYFMQVAGKYHHWLGGPEENAALGISVLA